MPRFETIAAAVIALGTAIVLAGTVYRLNTAEPRVHGHASYRRADQGAIQGKGVLGTSARPDAATESSARRSSFNRANDLRRSRSDDSDIEAQIPTEHDLDRLSSTGNDDGR